MRVYRQPPNQGIWSHQWDFSSSSLSLPPPLTGPCGKGDVVEQCALPDQTPVVVLRLTEALERLGEFVP